MRKRTAPPGPGLRKIENFCQKARSRDYKWCWIDTCCIDKRSSAELSEAINSMYKWYKRSAVCFVFLSDVALTDAEYASLVSPNSCWFSDRPQDFTSRFLSSVWFTRVSNLRSLSLLLSHSRDMSRNSTLTRDCEY